MLARIQLKSVNLQRNNETPFGAYVESSHILRNVAQRTLCLSGLKLQKLDYAICFLWGR